MSQPYADAVSAIRINYHSSRTVHVDAALGKRSCLHPIYHHRARTLRVERFQPFKYTAVAVAFGRNTLELLADCFVWTHPAIPLSIRALRVYIQTRGKPEMVDVCHSACRKQCCFGMVLFCATGNAARVNHTKYNHHHIILRRGNNDGPWQPASAHHSGSLLAGIKNSEQPRTTGTSL
ncbi:hypothetical protein D3C74_353840 [compost metagenome]